MTEQDAIKDIKDSCDLLDKAKKVLGDNNLGAAYVYGEIYYDKPELCFKVTSPEVSFK